MAQTSYFPATLASCGAQVDLERFFIVEFRHALLQFSCGDDHKIGHFAFEAMQHENPKLSRRILEFRSVQGEPTDTAELFPQFGIPFFWEEVFPVLHLQGNSMAVIAVGDEQINAKVFSRYPRIQL
jgi:hypothetical protein